MLPLLDNSAVEESLRSNIPDRFQTDDLGGSSTSDGISDLEIIDQDDFSESEDEGLELVTEASDEEGSVILIRRSGTRSNSNIESDGTDMDELPRSTFRERRVSLLVPEEEDTTSFDASESESPAKISEELQDTPFIDEAENATYHCKDAKADATVQHSVIRADVPHDTTTDNRRIVTTSTATGVQSDPIVNVRHSHTISHSVPLLSVPTSSGFGLRRRRARATSDVESQLHDSELETLLARRMRLMRGAVPPRTVESALVKIVMDGRSGQGEGMTPRRTKQALKKFEVVLVGVTAIWLVVRTIFVCEDKSQDPTCMHSLAILLVPTFSPHCNSANGLTLTRPIPRCSRTLSGSNATVNARSTSSALSIPPTKKLAVTPMSFQLPASPAQPLIVYKGRQHRSHKVSFARARTTSLVSLPEVTKALTFSHFGDALGTKIAGPITKKRGRSMHREHQRGGTDVIPVEQSQGLIMAPHSATDPLMTVEGTPEVVLGKVRMSRLSVGLPL
ncbi:hypothetical protein HDU93_006565 [Gonapodya sp. JEL0774]|nr:hypothetical protein HDU93_006565 [Gonapodya sp. JEL0774]